MKRSCKMVHDGGYVIGERDCGDLTEYFSPFCVLTETEEKFSERKNTLKLCCVFRSDKNFLKR